MYTKIWSLKKVKEKEKYFFFFYFSLFGKTDMLKKVAIFDWEWGRNSAPRDGQKIPCILCPLRKTLYPLLTA